MMDCTKAEKLLVEYLYQELSPEKTIQIEKHLHECDACAETLENWRAIHRGYQRSEDVPQAPVYMNQRILAAAREELKRKPSLSVRLFTLMRPALVLPILVFGILAILLLPQVKKQTEMVETSAPQPAKTASPAVAQREPAPKPQTPEELKSLGYLADDKRPVPPAGDSDLAKRKTDSFDTRSRDAAASKLEKDSSYPTGGAPADEISGMEKEGRYGARQQELSYEKQNQAAEQPQEAPAAPAQAARPSSVQAKTETLEEAASTDKVQKFRDAQNMFQNNELSGGKKVAEIAIQQDKEGDLAAQFHAAGRQYQSQGEPQQAIVQFNLVLNNYPAYPENADVLLRLGESYEQIGAYDQAIKTYQQLQRYSRMRKVAGEKLDSLNKKQQVQEQLRSLGYVDDKQ